MKKSVNIFFFLFLGFILFSCQSGKTEMKSDSRFYTDSIYSEHLGEYRKHNVYLPQGFDFAEKYSIIYATDGGEYTGKNKMKSTLDSLIGNEIIKPVIYIAAFSNDKIADSTGVTNGRGERLNITYRTFEYVETYINQSTSPQLKSRFKNHMLYFTEELIPQVEEKFNQNLEQADRVFYGFSNGAGFGANLLNKNPNIIGTYICYSTLGSHVENNEWKEKVQYPDLYLQYGDEEPIFFKMEAEDLAAKYKASNSFYDLRAFGGGHDHIRWHEEFTKTISELLKV